MSGGYTNGSFPGGYTEPTALVSNRMTHKGFKPKYYYDRNDIDKSTLQYYKFKKKSVVAYGNSITNGGPNSGSDSRYHAAESHNFTQPAKGFS
ncbi:hypothetical protein HAX54_050444 [Datura stramonium]|uniref:Uncharacterized protein n=1 Tax=Datura stramonium TaxID=4076 RepID=A0ABS8WP71_DATST|nr:hypothetical protein [Datura stramonium]